jgi:hypothetical protein
LTLLDNALRYEENGLHQALKRRDRSVWAQCLPGSA